MRLRTTLALLALAAAAQSQALAQVPAPSTNPVPQGAYSLDKAHTSLIFQVSHLGFSTFKGRFTRLDAQLNFDPAKPANSSVNVTIDPHSISSDNAPEGFLESLASGAEWLESGKFPELKFVSTSVNVRGDTLRVNGELTLHGVTRPLVLEARYNGGYAGHTFEPHARVGFSATGSFKRSDFGLNYGVPAPGTTFGVGDEVKVVLEAEFTGPPLKVAKN